MSYDVILATYCGENYIKAQISSILSQTVLPSMIIVRDDVSTDATLDVLDEIKNKSVVPVKVISGEKNIGYIKNFEELVKQARSEIVFFSDQDDIWVENKAEILLDVFKKNKEMNVVFSDATLINNDLVNLGALWQHIGFQEEADCNNLERILINNIVTGATMAARKNFLDTLLPFPAGVPHDYWIACNACTEKSLKSVAQKLILYRQHENNHIGAKKNTLLGTCFSVFSNKKRIKRIEHYREIHTLLSELEKRGRMKNYHRLYSNFFKYISCANVIYDNKIFENSSDKKMSFLKSLLDPYYIKYSTRKMYLAGLLDGFFLRIK